MSSGMSDIVAQLVPGAVRPALGGAAVVGDDGHDRVVGLPAGLDCVEHAADVVIGVRKKAGVDLHHPGVEPSAIGIDIAPCLDPVRPSGKFGVRWDDAHLLLAGERPFSPIVPAPVEVAGESIDPLWGAWCGAWGAAVAYQRKNGRSGWWSFHWRRRWMASSARLASRWYPRRGWRGLDVLLITDEVWCPLIGLTVKKAVVVLEANAGRPHVVGASGALVASGEVPFPDCRGHVAIGL